MSRSVATPGKGRRDLIIRSVALIGAVCAVLLAAGPVRAEDTEEAAAAERAARAAAEFRKLFVDASGCYARTYDAAHLAAHPRQRVTSMTVARMTAFRGPKETWSVEGDYLILRLTLRGKGPKRATGGATCSGLTEEGRLRCWSDVCDGGSLQVTAAPGGRLRLTLDSFALSGCGGEEEDAGEVVLSAASDDTAFLLDPLPPDQCSTTFVVKR